MVGVVPNAAYRHFADRDALLAAVRDEAVRVLAQRMGDRMSQVRAGPHTPTGARLRLQAVGTSYLDFARTEPGLFDTAFAATDHVRPVSEPTNRDRWTISSRRSTTSSRPDSGARPPPNIEYPTWATVHGLAVLLRGPLAR